MFKEMKRLFGSESRDLRDGVATVEALAAHDPATAVQMLQQIVERIDVARPEYEKERAQLLAIANRSNILQLLPRHLEERRVPLSPLPEERVLNERLQPLEFKELREALDHFVQHILDGTTPMFVNGKLDEASVQLSTANQDLVSDAYPQRRADDPGEAPRFYDKLANGYRKAKKLFTPAIFDTLMKGASFRFQNETNREKYHHVTGRKFEDARRDILLITELQDVYMGRNAQVQMAQDRLAHSPTDPTLRPHPELYTHPETGKRMMSAFLPCEVSPMKCLRLRIRRAAGQLAGDPRNANIEFFVVLGNSNQCHQELHHSDGPSNYVTYLRALRTTPDFFLESIRAAVPEIFSGLKGKDRNFYDPAKMPANLIMQMWVPELQAIGVQEEIGFHPRSQKSNAEGREKL